MLLCCLQCFNRRPRRLLTTAEARHLALASLAWGKTTGQYLRHSSSCSWFLRRTGRRQPSTISTCRKHGLIYILKRVNVSKIKITYFRRPTEDALSAIFVICESRSRVLWENAGPTKDDTESKMIIRGPENGKIT